MMLYGTIPYHVMFFVLEPTSYFLLYSVILSDIVLYYVAFCYVMPYLFYYVFVI